MDLSQYPKPPVPYTGYSPIYFATEDRVRSVLNLSGHDDRGELVLKPRRITFTGMRVLVDCTNVVAIDMARETFAWPGALGAGLLLVAMVYVGGDFGGLPWGQPPTFLAMLLFVMVLSARSWRQWVQVEYLEPRGDVHRAYFRHEAALRPAFRGTHRLCAEMRLKVLGDSDG